MTAAYFNSFEFDTHVFGGYEFNDRWAVGGGAGLDLTTYGSNAIAAGFLAAYVRFTPWHGYQVED